MKAVILISHGSRLAKTKDEVRDLIEKLKKLLSIPLIEYGFLEIESPSIPEAIDSCVAKKATEVIVLLNFLNAGRHVDKDIPQILDDARKKFPHVTFHMTEPIGQHAQIPVLFAQMLSSYLDQSNDK